MAKVSLHFVYYFFLITFCIDEGDGRWKKIDKENLQRDIKLYRKITERVEHELQEYYAEYEDHGLLHLNFNRKYYETNRNTPKDKARIGREHNEDKQKQSLLSRLKDANSIPIYNKTISNNSSLTNQIAQSTDVKPIDYKLKWPKFEEILLAIGKKYDWKNDRWIKVRQKFKIKKDFGELDNSIMFHEKHRFSYKTIKLNRGKNKRNVVIAVTAIR